MVFRDMLWKKKCVGSSRASNHTYLCHNRSRACDFAIVFALFVTWVMSSSAVFSARAIALSNAGDAAWRGPVDISASAPPFSFKGLLPLEGLFPAPHPSLLSRIAIASPPSRATRASTAFEVPTNLVRARQNRSLEGRKWSAMEEKLPM